MRPGEMTEFERLVRQDTFGTPRRWRIEVWGRDAAGRAAQGPVTATRINEHGGRDWRVDGRWVDEENVMTSRWGVRW